MQRSIAPLLCTLLLATVLAPAPASAVITFTQLDDDIFVVSHRIKALGLRGKAMKLVYQKTASLCVAAGYTHYQILDQESDTGQHYESANASLRARFHLAAGDERVGCEKNASPQYVAQARKKLAKRGYQPPPPEPPSVPAPAATPAPAAAPAAPPAAEGATDTGRCTIAQITTMVEAGLTQDQIAAACNDG